MPETGWSSQFVSVVEPSTRASTWPSRLSTSSPHTMENGGGSTCTPARTRPSKQWGSWSRRCRLPPFLVNAFGDSTGLVAVGSGKARDQTSHPDVDPSLSLLNVTGDASRPGLLEDYSKHNSVAEVVELLKLELQFLIHAEPALNEATNCRLAFEDVP